MFLYVVNSLPHPAQVKLLRVLQERRVLPVGALKETEVDLRVVSASNADLEAEVRAGRFREDLYYRINVVQIPLPPLRERLDDLPEL
ncbi:MAG: sigma 54-interacting transcriptional regulator, partial [bacterium]